MTLFRIIATVVLVSTLTTDSAGSSGIQIGQSLPTPLIRPSWLWNPVRWCQKYKDKICDDINFRNMTNDNVTLTCKNGKCAGVEYATIKKMYRGMFQTQSQINLVRERYITRLTGNTMQWPRPKSIRSTNSDWDQCCPTQHDFVQMPGAMVNVDNKIRTIVHFPDKRPEPEYQAAHVGTCFPGGSCKSCIQTNKLVALLVIDPSYSCFPPFMVDIFEIGSHCVCRDLGSGK